MLSDAKMEVIKSHTKTQFDQIDWRETNNTYLPKIEEDERQLNGGFFEKFSIQCTEDAPYPGGVTKFTHELFYAADPEVVECIRAEKEPG